MTRIGTMGLTCLRFLCCVSLMTGIVVSLSTSADAAASITEAHYSAKVEKKLVRIVVSLTVQITSSQSATIPLDLGDAVVKQPSEENVQLLGTGDGRYALILSGDLVLSAEGERTVELHLTVPVRDSDGDDIFELHCPAAAVNILDLSIPKADQEIQLTPFSVPLSVEKPDKASTDLTQIRAQFGSTSTIQARWYLKNRVKPKIEPIVGVTNTLQVVIDEKTKRSIASLKYRVWQGEIETLQFVVPLGDRILDVSAPEVGLESWEAVSEEKRQLVTVRLLKRLSGAIEIEVHTESDVPAESFEIAGVGKEGTVHGIHSHNGLREAGVIIVSQTRTTPLSVAQQDSVIQIGENAVPEALRHPHAQYFRFYNPKMQLALSAPVVSREEMPVVIDRPVIEKALIEVVIGGTGGNSTAKYRCRYRLKSGLQKRLAFELPIGAEMISTSINGKSIALKSDQNEEPRDQPEGENEEGNEQADEEENEDDSQDSTGNYFLDITEYSETNEIVLLTIIFQKPIGPLPFEDRLGKLHLPLPKVRFNEEVEPSEQQLQIAVWVPHRFALIGRPEGYLKETSLGLSDLLKSREKTDLQAENLAGWIGDTSVMSSEFSTQGRVTLFRLQGEAGPLEVYWCDMPFAGWTLSLSLFLIAWVLRRTSWKNKLGVLLVAVFATALISLEEPDWVYQGWIASRYGLIAMLGLWLIQSLPGVSPKRKSKVSIPSSLTPPPEPSTPVIIPPPDASKATKVDFNLTKPAATK